MSNRWADATLGLGTIDTALLDVVHGGAPFRLEFAAALVGQIAGYDLPLGEARYVFRVAMIENYEQLVRTASTGDMTGAEAKLRPGDDDSYEVTLVAPPAIGFEHQDMIQPVVVSRNDLDAARRRPLRRDAFQPAVQ